MSAMNMPRRYVFSLVAALLSWGCTLAILVLNYRYTLKLGCGHDYGCQTDLDLLTYGLPLFIVQFCVLSPLAILGLLIKVGRRLPDQAERVKALAWVLVATAPTLSVAGGFLAGIYTSYKLRHGY